jgi:hypothetical protein
MTTNFPEMIDGVTVSDESKFKMLLEKYFNLTIIEKHVAIQLFDEFIDWQTQQRKAISELIHERKL